MTSRGSATTSRRLDTAWALLVVSSEAQAETLEHQRSWAERAAKAEGWKLTRVIDGVASGRKGPRSLVRALLRDVADAPSRPNVLMMTRLDRIGRGSIVDSQIVLRDLLELGVRVFTREHGFVDVDSAMGELISAVRLAVARQENDVRRDKLLGVYERKRRAGLAIGNRRPYGLRRGADGKDISEPKLAKVIARAFELRIRGRSFESIGAELQKTAAPWQSRDGREHKPVWAASRVSRMLKNRAYVGPIVDEVTFARVQRVNAGFRKSATQKFPWPLSGAIHCVCGRHLCGRATGRKDARVRYYACGTRGAHDDERGRFYRADSIEAQFLEWLSKLQARRDVVVRQQSAERNSKDLASQIASAKRDVARIVRRREAAWEANAKAALRAEDLRERLDRLNAEQREIETRLLDLEQRQALVRGAKEELPSASALLKTAPALFAKGTVDEQRQIARAVAAIVGGFYVDEKTHQLVRGKPPSRRGLLSINGKPHRAGSARTG